MVTFRALFCTHRQRKETSVAWVIAFRDPQMRGRGVKEQHSGEKPWRVCARI